MPPLVSVIVVTRDGRRWLDDCLASVRAQQGVETEIVLVDNASSDGSAELVRERFPGVRVVRLDENRGFAGGNNAGAAVATGRWLAFLNNDTRADPRWLRALLDAVARRPEFRLATSRLVFMDRPDLLDSAGDGVFRPGGAFKRGHGQPAAGWMREEEVFGACGAAFLIDRELFLSLGGFDEAFFATFEDVDLSYRARLAGERCLYVPDSLVLHAGSATLGRVSRRAVYLGQRNVEWMWLKNTPAPILLRTLLAHLVYEGAAALHFARLGMFDTFVRAKLAAVTRLPAVLRQRREVQASARVPAAEIWRLLERGWINRKRLEKRFDLSPRGTAR